MGEILIYGLFCLIWGYKPTSYDTLVTRQYHRNSINISSTILALHPGDTENTKKSSEEEFKRMLYMYFPDWEERRNFQNQQAKFYLSGSKRLSKSKQIGMEQSMKLTPEEQDAFDYFNGEGFYTHYQNLETPPNIFDTKQSFLLKMEKNREMRHKFQDAWERRENERTAGINQ